MTPIEEAALALYEADDDYRSALRIPGASEYPSTAWVRVNDALNRLVEAETEVIVAIREARPRC
jgi:hypothetical protein